MIVILVWQSFEWSKLVLRLRGPFKNTGGKTVTVCNGWAWNIAPHIQQTLISTQLGHTTKAAASPVKLCNMALAMLQDVNSMVLVSRMWRAWGQGRGAQNYSCRLYTFLWADVTSNATSSAGEGRARKNLGTLLEETKSCAPWHVADSIKLLCITIHCL